MRRMIVWLLSLSAMLAAGGAQAQSFNCRSADFPDEFLICESPELSRLDERLDRVFRQNMGLLSRAEQRALDREEERWVVSRRRCGRNYDCIAGHYYARIGELSERLHGLRGDAPAPRFDRPPPPKAERRAPEPAWRSREARSADDRDLERARPERPRRTETAAPRPKAPTTAPERQEVAPRRQAPTSPANAAGSVAERERRGPREATAPPQGSASPADRASGGTRAPRIEFVDPPPSR